MTDTHLTALTRYIKVDGDRFAYRRWGKPTDVPLFFVQHFRGGMDHWDPLLTDGLAEGREVILFNGRGIASSSGTPRDRMEGMADDIAAVIRALGLAQVDLIGFSIGGMQVQEVTLRHPTLVRKLLLLGTIPRGGDPRMDPRVLEVAPRPVPTLDDFLFLFFGRSQAARKAGSEFWERRHLRVDQDPPSSLAVAQAQAAAHAAYVAPAGDDPLRPAARHPAANLGPERRKRHHARLDQLMASGPKHPERPVVDLSRCRARSAVPIPRTIPETRDSVSG